jgi:hypothetical protein
MVSKVTLALALALTLGACATQSTGGAGGAFCSVAEPIRLSADAIEHLNDSEARNILGHNKHGQAECGWKP